MPVTLQTMASPRLRQGRCSEPGNIYALTTVTEKRCRLFEHPDNAQIVIEALRFVERSSYSHSLAWVVMPDHVHWLMQLRRDSLAGCMALFKSRSSRLLNQRLHRQGRVWQHGYFDHAIRRDASLLNAARYILANPIRAGLSETLGEYPHAWSRWPL